MFTFLVSVVKYPYFLLDMSVVIQKISIQVVLLFFIDAFEIFLRILWFIFLVFWCFNPIIHGLYENLLTMTDHTAPQMPLTWKLVLKLGRLSDGGLKSHWNQKGSIQIHGDALQTSRF